MDARCSARRTPAVAERAQGTAVLERRVRAVNCSDRCRVCDTSQIRLV